MNLISACVIVKNDPHLAQAIACIRPYVDEVVIVDTGSTDGTDAVAERLADKFERFTACNFDDGDMADFASARNRSLDLATHDTIVWLDSDDLVAGLEHLRETVAWCHAQAHGEPWRAKFPYEYDKDPEGRVITLQQRERVVHPKSAFRWIKRVHEGLTAIHPTGWQTLEPSHPIVWKHQIDPTKKRSQRNLRILRDHVRQVGPDNVDVQTQFELGVELGRIGNHAQATAWLARYVEQSDWDEERVLACLNLVDIYAFYPAPPEQSLAARWAHRAIEILPGSPEGYWALAKLSHKAAGKDADRERKHLDRVVHYARKGLAQTERIGSVPTNPRDRGFNIPWILQDALARLGRPGEALAALRACLADRPDDVVIRLRERELEHMSRTGRNLVDVAIVCGITPEAWDPANVAKRGIGGSETAVIEMAKRLVAQGARVRVYCRCDAPGLYDGVEYHSMGEVEEANGCDLLIAWRNASLLEATPARVKWLWLHDTVAIGGTPWTLSLADRILVLSHWHAKHIGDLYPSAADKLTVTRNGIDLTRFEQTPERHPRKAIYSSSADRGLEPLLEMWPHIRARVPDAELHVFYGFAGLSKEGRQGFLDLIARTEGVVARDRVDQKTLANEMCASGAWLYPSWAGDKPFTETSCIGSLEAQAAGLRIVTSSHGALPESVGCGVIVAGDATSESYRQAFVESAVEALTRSDDTDRLSTQRHARERFGWDDVATSWFTMAIADVASAPAKTRLAHIADGRPTLHMILAPQASGDLVMDASGDPGSEAMGGGSRVGFLGLVKAMGELGGYKVRAFSTFKAPRVERDGVEYLRLDQMTSYGDPDIAFAYYDTSPLPHFGPGTLRIASHHTYSPYMHFDSADVNTAPSQAAMEFLRDRYEPVGDWRVLPNAVGPMAIERKPVPGRVIYHTSPDRGLHLLLRAWATIKRAVPNASLHVVGGVEEILDAKLPKGRHGDRLKAIQNAYAEAAALGGIHLLGRLSRADLWRELAEASAFAFPCSPVAPCETFSISIMECCKLGIPVVLSPADSLESIYTGHVRMTPAPAADHVDEFAEAVVDVLTSDREASRLAAAGKDLAAKYTFDKAAEVLDDIIYVQRQARAAERLYQAAQ